MNHQLVWNLTKATAAIKVKREIKIKLIIMLFSVSAIQSFIVMFEKPNFFSRTNSLYSEKGIARIKPGIAVISINKRKAQKLFMMLSGNPVMLQTKLNIKG